MAIPFPESVKDQAFARSGGRCECNRMHAGLQAPHHGGRCPRTFTRQGAWEAHHINADGPAVLSNCEALCTTCHELTRSYGR
jgi:hypothetical protein